MLERNEVIALFNTLERLAAGVEVVRDLSLQLRCAGGACTVWLVIHYEQRVGQEEHHGGRGGTR